MLLLLLLPLLRHDRESVRFAALLSDDRELKQSRQCDSHLLICSIRLWRFHGLGSCQILMEVANLPNLSRAFFVDSRAQCCSRGSSLADSAQFTDAIARRGSRNKSCLILPGKERIHTVGLKGPSKRSIESRIDQASYFPSSLSSPKYVLDAGPCKINGVSDSVPSQSKRRGSIFTKSMKKNYKSGRKWSKDLAEYVVVAVQVNLEQKRSVVPEETSSKKGHCIREDRKYDLFVKNRFQEQIRESCVEAVEFQNTHPADTLAFELEASENNRRKRRTGSNSQKKMEWQTCAASAFAAGCAALGIRKLQSVFVETIAGGSTNLGYGDGGGAGNSGGWGQGGGGGMEESGSNVGRLNGAIFEKDDDIEEVSSTPHCEELESMKDTRGSKIPALASLSSATTAYRLNADLKAGGETVVDNNISDKTMGQTSLGTREQLLRLATEAPQPQGVEYPAVRNVEEFGDNSRRKNSNSQFFPEGNAQWFEGEAHIHLTRIGLGSGLQNNEDNTPRLNASPFLQQTASSSKVVSSNNKETFVESNLTASGTTKSEGQLNLENSAYRSICDGILSPLSQNSVQTSDLLHHGRSFNDHEKSESILQSEQSDMKVVPSNPGKMGKRSQFSVSKVAGHAGDFDPQVGSTQSDKITQEGPLGRIANLVHSAVVKRTGGQGTSHKNAQESEDHERKHLVTEAVALVLQQLFERTGDEALARRYEIAALKRLQRETSTDLLKIRERLDKLEHHAGLRQIKSLGDPLGVARTRLKGLVNVGAAFVLLQDKNSRHSRYALDQAGMQTGLDVRFTFETPFRDKDLLILECGSGQGNDSTEGVNLGGPIRVTKIAYSAQVSDELMVSLIPLGAASTDVSDIVHSLQDQALTRFASSGPPLFGRFKGSAIGATFRNTDALLSISHCLSGWGNLGSFNCEPLCSSTLATCIYQPSDSMIFSVSAVNNFYPSPPLPSSARLHWSEMGPLVISKSRASPSDNSAATSLRVSDSSSVSQGNSSGVLWNSQSFESKLPETKGTSVQAFSVAGEVDIGSSINVGGWMQIDRGNLFQEAATKQLQWALTLSKSAGSAVDWGLCLGTSKPYFWNAPKSAEKNYFDPADDMMEVCASQTQFEAFVNLNCGKGCVLQPGILCVLNKHSQTPALILRAHWGL